MSKAADVSLEVSLGHPDESQTPAAATGPGTFLPSITTPKGGGALRGIGETFRTNLQTGTASLTVPISTPTGRHGFDLGLALAYDSGSGNGVFGLGWRLELPSITRKTDRGIPRYGPDDTFILAAEDLVPAPPPGDSRASWQDGDFDIQTYRPRVDGSYARIERWTKRVAGDIHWRVWSRDNSLQIFGSSPDARIADPTDPQRIHTWLLEEARNGRGDIVRYVYIAEDGARVERYGSEAHRFAGGVFRATAQRYLKRIYYGNRRPNVGRSNHPEDWLFEVVLDYGEHDVDAPTPEAAPGQQWPKRKDAFSSARPGFEVRTYRLVRRFLQFSRFDEWGGAPRLVQATTFDYEERSTATFLTRVTQVGYKWNAPAGKYDSLALPSLSLSYTEPDPSVEPGADTSGAAPAWKSVRGFPRSGSAASDWLDLDGRGLPDLFVRSEGAWHRWRNLGNGELCYAGTERSLPAGATKSDVLLTDAGRGRLDAFKRTGPTPGVWPRLADGTFGAFKPLQAMPSVGLSGESTHTLDADGDGVGLDVIGAAPDRNMYFLFRDGTYEGPYSRPADREEPPLFHAIDNTAFAVDMTGDGLVDEVRVSRTHVRYRGNHGYAEFSDPVTIGLPSVLADRFDPARVRFADVDGSGTSDLLYLRDDCIALYLNESANSFAGPILIPFPKGTDGKPVSGGDVRAIDVLGQGTTALLWFAPGPSGRVEYLDLSGGTKPHVINRIANSFGGGVSIEYGSSSAEFLRDERSDDSRHHWLTRVPSPVTLIKAVTRTDHVTKGVLRSEFSYRHGHYDTAEREYRGFAFVEQRDVDSDAGQDPGSPAPQPPTVTRSWFHTGAFLEGPTLESALVKTYWTVDSAAELLPDTIVPDNLSLADSREAVRALRGRQLRQEVYTDDGTPGSVPFVVREKNHRVRLVAASGSGPNAIFDVHAEHALEFSYERDPAAPRVSHELALEVDAYGNVTRSASIAYGSTQSTARAEQKRMWATYVERSFARYTARDGWRTAAPAREDTYELAGVQPTPGKAYAGSADVQRQIGQAATVPFEKLPDGTSLQQRLIGSRRVRYRREDNSGPLAWGKTGALALVHQQYSLALPATLVVATYGSDMTQALRSGGYVTLDGDWYIPSGRPSYRPADFYVIDSYTDAFGNVYTVGYDQYQLLALTTTDPLGNAIRVESASYEVLKPVRTRDPNGDVMEVEFDPLGRVTAVWRRGHDGTGDDDDHPGFVFHYAAGDAYLNSNGSVPIYSDAWARTSFKQGPKRPTNFATATARRHGVLARTFIDGFGRQHLVKLQAESSENGTPRWVDSAYVVYENKHGKPARVYEPHFSDTLGYAPQAVGAYHAMAYDPLGRRIRVEHPDGTLVRVEFDAWEQASWDETDTVAEALSWLARMEAGTPSQKHAARQASKHKRTPAQTSLDALGRAFLQVEDAGDGAGQEVVNGVEQPHDLREIKTILDVQGKAQAVVDQRTIRVLDQSFDALGRLLLSHSADAGRRATLPDVFGQVAIAWDARGYEVTREYDSLRRPAETWVLEPGAARGDERLVQKTIYGEDTQTPEANRLRLQAHATYDEAGALTTPAYDLAGNPLETIRRVATDPAVPLDWSFVAGVDGAGNVAAQVDAAGILELLGYSISSSFDALGRLTKQTTPDGHEVSPRYNEANLLDGLSARLRPSGDPNGTLAPSREMITNIEYNARGQRTHVEHANGIIETYEYDDRAFRLARQRAKSANGTALQDLTYTYDPVGNVVALDDAVNYGHSGVHAGGRYEYDPLYQLISATGREHPGLQSVALYGPSPAHFNDLQALTEYTETYSYDPAGNLLELNHRELRSDRRWKRVYEYASDSNRLKLTRTGNQATGSTPYVHDHNGNLELPHLVESSWDWADRLSVAKKEATDNPGIINHLYFAYDASGQRVRKAYVHSGVREESIYVGGFEIYRNVKLSTGQTTFSRETLHLSDGRRRVASLETNTADTSQSAFAPARIWRHHVADPLQSTRLEIADDGTSVITYEEYFPFGETSVRVQDSQPGFSQKPYRYNGKERDEETGLYYFGTRYYAAWLQRWTGADPLGMADGTNLFRYVRNNPLINRDPRGTRTVSAEDPDELPDSEEPTALDFSGSDLEEISVGEAMVRTTEEYMREGLPYPAPGESGAGPNPMGGFKASDRRSCSPTVFSAYADVVSPGFEDLRSPDAVIGDLTGSEFYDISQSKLVDKNPNLEHKQTRGIVDAWELTGLGKEVSLSEISRGDVFITKTEKGGHVRVITDVERFERDVHNRRGIRVHSAGDLKKVTFMHAGFGDEVKWGEEGSPAVQVDSISGRALQRKIAGAKEEVTFGRAFGTVLWDKATSRPFLPAVPWPRQN